MGNPHELTAGDAASRRGWSRTTLYAAGTLSMLAISMVSSLSLWIFLPWTFLEIGRAHV